MDPKRTLTVFRYCLNGKEYYPVIPILFLIGGRRVRALGLIDSGATVSVFGEETAQSLNIEIEKGKKTILGGVGGRIVGYLHKLKIKVAGKTLVCPIVFSREYLVSFNLLGREGFFENFVVVFDEKGKEVRLE